LGLAAAARGSPLQPDHRWNRGQPAIDGYNQCVKLGTPGQGAGIAGMRIFTDYTDF